ncbi:MAG: AAA family ATPase [Treponema sp.]|nr:AAA family ATPase [Treponema sp.]
MEFTKAGVAEQITSVLTESSGRINPSVITQKLKWNKDMITEIRALFGVQKFSEVLKQIPEIEMQKDEHGTVYAQIVHNDNTNATTEENMAKNTTTMDIHERMGKLLEMLNTNFLEREEAVRLSLLAAVAGESIFYLGAPGVGKSMLARRIKEAFKCVASTNNSGNSSAKGEIKYFEYLMNQFSTPDTIFGPASLPDLEKGVIKTLTDGYLPTADVAFLDEIWKANSIILNTLLWIINEKKYKNGNVIEDVPLKLLVTASNELPPKDEGLDAVWDRMIVRLTIDEISDESKLLEMITQGSNAQKLTLDDEMKKLLITADELKKWQSEIDEVEFSQEAAAVFSAVRKALQQKNAETDRDDAEKYYVSPRRWKKIVHLLRTSAFLNGRNEVDLMDCQLIEYCIWNTERQQEEAKLIVRDCIQQNGVPYDSEIEEINAEIKDFLDYINKNFYTTTSTTDATTGKAVKKLIKDTSIFGKPAVLKSMQDTADSEEYTPIKEHIEKQLEELQQFRDEMAAPFEANLFADQQCGAAILSVIDSAKKALEKTKVELDEKRSRYQQA